MKPNQTPQPEIEDVPIEKMAFGGAGIARLKSGLTCFVHQVLPGENVRIRITQKKKHHALAELVKILTPSPDRTTPACPVFGICGGCDYQHINYPTQLQIKRDILSDTLARLAGLKNLPIEPVRPSPLAYGYRNRIQVHTQSGQTGFIRRDGRGIIKISHCPIASDRVNQLLSDFLKSRPHDGRHILSEPAPWRGFRQVNFHVAKILLQEVITLVPSANSLIDAYCGAGFFTLPLSAKFPVVIGIEWSAPSLQYAQTHAPQNAKFIQGDVAHHLPQILSGAQRPVGLLLDPPAEGCSLGVIQAIRSAPPEWIIYVSCNPPSLARDLSRLKNIFHIERIIPLDMFPQTAQIECLCLLNKTTSLQH